MKGIIFALILLVFLAVPVFADSTQQSNKIFLNPFYRVSMESNIWYDYTVIVNPPDNIEQVTSAIVIFEVWMTPTVIFDLKVDGQSCNNPTYQIHTTYAGSGWGSILFDCSNIINGDGEYDLSIRSSKNTGAITGWLDLTYMNDPLNEKGNEVIVKGTDYFIGDRGTVFLQLRDGLGEAVNNGDCHLNIYKPNIVNMTHPIWIDNAPMLYLNGSSGVYYYDINMIPNVTGIYMIDASCSYLFSNHFYYGPHTGYSPKIDVIHGTYIGNPEVLNAYDDYVYRKCDSTTANPKRCEAYYTFEIDDVNVSSLDVLFLGEADDVYDMITYVWNWTSSTWIELPNILTFSGEAINSPSGVNDFVSNSISDFSNTIHANNSVKIRLYSSSISVFKQFNNFLNLKASQTGTVVTDVKGAGEIHVSENSVLTVENVTNVADAQASFFDLKYAGGTEYKSGEEGFLVYQWLRIQAGSPTPISDADYCNFTVWYPNGTKLFDNVQSTYLTGSDAVYQYNFTTPSVEGVFVSQAYCFRSVGNYKGYGASTFHVSPSNNEIFNIEGYVGNLDANMQNNFTNTNNLVTNFFNALNVSLSNWFGNISLQITNLNDYLNTTLTRIEWKIDNLNTTLTNITLGNVTLTVNVDEREIALDTLRIFCYYGAIDIYGQDICRGELEGGVVT